MLRQNIKQRTGDEDKDDQRKPVFSQRWWEEEATAGRGNSQHKARGRPAQRPCGCTELSPGPGELGFTRREMRTQRILNREMYEVISLFTLYIKDSSNFSLRICGCGANTKQGAHQEAVT